MDLKFFTEIQCNGKRKIKGNSLRKSTIASKKKDVEVVLQLTSLLILNFFLKKTFGLHSLSFSSLYQKTTNMKEASYYQKYAKPSGSSIYTKFRNSSAKARVITGGALDKVGQIESHNYHQRLIKYQNPSTLTIDDSIAKGLRRYMDVWDRYFG